MSDLAETVDPSIFERPKKWASTGSSTKNFLSSSGNSMVWKASFKSQLDMKSWSGATGREELERQLQMEIAQTFAKKQKTLHVYIYVYMAAYVNYFI